MAPSLDLSNVEAVSSDHGQGRGQTAFSVKRGKQGAISTIQGEPQNAEVNPYQEC